MPPLSSVCFRELRAVRQSSGGSVSEPSAPPHASLARQCLDRKRCQAGQPKGVAPVTSTQVAKVVVPGLSGRTPIEPGDRAQARSIRTVEYDELSNAAIAVSPIRTLASESRPEAMSQKLYGQRVVHVVFAKRGNNSKALPLQIRTRSAFVKIGDDAIRSAKSKQESFGVKG